jgi:hypothetical protein
MFQLCNKTEDYHCWIYIMSQEWLTTVVIAGSVGADQDDGLSVKRTLASATSSSHSQVQSLTMHQGRLEAELQQTEQKPRREGFTSYFLFSF